MTSKKSAKKTSAISSETSTSRPPSLSRFSQIIILISILIMTGLLMLNKADDSYRGFMGFNEGYYSNFATEYVEKPFHHIVTTPKDLNNPPLYLLLLSAIFKLFDTEAIYARSLSIVCSLGAVYFVYRLAKHAYGEIDGLMAALLFGLNPAFQLVGRNVQPESLFILTILASLYFYLISLEQNNNKKAAFAGMILGLGILTKLPAFLLLIAIILWHLISKRKDLVLCNRFGVFAGTAVAVGMSWYVCQALLTGSSFLSSQGRLAGTFRFPDAVFFKTLLLTEVFWALSPLIFLTAVIAVVYSLANIFKTQFYGGKETLFLITSGIFLCFYMFYHYHTYYLLPIIPFILLVTAHVLIKPSKQNVHLIIMAFGIIIILSFFSFAMLGAHKYGFDEYEQVAEIVNDIELETEKIVLVVPELIYGSDSPILQTLMPNVEISTESNPDKFPKDRRVFWWLKAKGYDEEFVNKPGVWVCNSSRHSPTVFGYRVSVNPLLPTHRFDMGEISLEAAPDSSFGMSVQTYPVYLLLDMSQNTVPSENEVIR